MAFYSLPERIGQQKPSFVFADNIVFQILSEGFERISPVQCHKRSTCGSNHMGQTSHPPSSEILD